MTKSLLKTTSAMALAATMALPAFAQGTVNLISADGTVDIVGEFVEFTENSYVIKTALGELRLSAERVRCEGAACPTFDTGIASGDSVVLAGSDALGLGVMPLLMEGFAGHLDAEVTSTSTGENGQLLAKLVGDGGFGDDIGSYFVNSSNTDAAFEALLAGEAEIGMAARRIKPDEARALRAAGAGNMVDPANEHIVAIDSIVVIVNPENGVSRLTTQQVGDIYAGRITNWSQVGGKDLPITVVGRQEDSGTSAIFYRTVLGESSGGWSFADDIEVAENNTEAAAMVNANPGAIGFVGYAFQRGAKPLSLVNACGITETPDAFSARTEEYALQRRLYLYNTDGSLSDSASQFMDYALSSDADPVIRKAGFIDLGVASRTQTIDSDRAQMLLDPTADAYEGGVMRDMLDTMVNYDRLSTTFRFRTGSSKLDERGRVDMERLAQYLETAPAGTEIKFVGFTDSVGAFDSNRELAEQRASQVLAEMRAKVGDRLDGITMTTAAYGEVAPSACNATDRGRSINRRVEVWITAAG